MLKQLALFVLTTSNLVVGLTITGITVDSFEGGNEPAKAIDGNTSTFWHSEYTPTLTKLPHHAILDLGASNSINGFTYTPRQDGNQNGNIGQYSLEWSTNNITWTLITNSTWADDQSQKLVGFTTITARYIRVTGITEAGNRGPWSSAAEFGILAPATTNLSTVGQWGPVIAFPIVPAAGYLVPSSGQIVTWASYEPNNYLGSGNTYTATFTPSSGAVSEMDVTNTGHDMFCPGLSVDANGRAVVTGGDDADLTSIYVPATSSWIAAAKMNIPRGYQSSATCSDGRIFTIGGSWSGGEGGKNGEIYNPSTNQWTLLPNCSVSAMLTADARGIFRADNHGWLFGWKNGQVFQAGPSSAMNWYGTASSGSTVSAGTRASDPDSMCGNAVMYDAVNGKILTVGGSPSYDNSYATTNAHIITIGAAGAMPSVQTIASMNYARAFANGVILPNGNVLVTGGQTYAVPFTDTNAILTPEIWNPTTQQFTVVAPHVVPRNYHSIALLMLDGRVFTGGGGLCGSCATNHENAQIYSPPYLFNTDGTAATRPTISAVSSTVLKVGTTFTVTTTATSPTFAIIRYGSATHTVDTDQRRIALTPSIALGSIYTLTIPADSGVALPGYWMLFVINSSGVPSVASTIQITT